MKPGYQGHDAMREKAEKIMGVKDKGGLPIKLAKGGHAMHSKHEHHATGGCAYNHGGHVKGKKMGIGGMMGSSLGGTAGRLLGNAAQKYLGAPSWVGDITSGLGSALGNVGGTLAGTALGMPFKKGGTAKPRAAKPKMALGGVAKIRHDQMTPSGKQIPPRRARGG